MFYLRFLIIYNDSCLLWFFLRLSFLGFGISYIENDFGKLWIKLSSLGKCPFHECLKECILWT